MKCKCGQPSDGWPDDKAGEELCQMCWEAYWDAEFWRQMGDGPPTIEVQW